MTQRRLLEDIGVIGDTETLALVDRFGSVVWFCWPRFDSPSVFGALLDDDGGHWTLRPTSSADQRRGRQFYRSDTNVLVTRFHCSNGVLEVEDSMSMTGARALVRRVACTSGSVSVTSDFALRPDYGRTEAATESGERDVTFRWADQALALRSSVALSLRSDPMGIRVMGEFDLQEGERAAFELTDPATLRAGTDDLVQQVDTTAAETVRHWQAWSSANAYSGRRGDAVRRSALTLKLLTHGTTGGLIAAGTTSIPEAIGGDRNWDYRYVWLRDSAFTVYALLELGFRAEAERFTDWLTERLSGCEQNDPPLAPLYGLDGERDLGEFELDHWAGFARTTPIRIGNGAAEQLQLDVFGEVMDALYLTDRAGSALSLETWTHVQVLVDYVIENWKRPDQGMWEVRSDGERHTSSALMCWVALERAMRMASRGGRPADVERWRATRDEIHATILDAGWNDEMRSFTRTLGGDDVDASLLLMPLVKFVAGDDPRWLSTLDTIGERLAHGPLVDRYDTDLVDEGVDGDEGAFLLCSFWYVEALARAGRTDEARERFDGLLAYAGPLGLFSEEVGPDGRLLGNFPQAFTHLSLISAAVHLDEALDASADRPQERVR